MRSDTSKPQIPKILIGSPVYSDKKYITPYWIEHVKKIEYPNYDILVVDNSKHSDNFENLFVNDGIKVVKSKYYTNPFKRLSVARQKLNDLTIKGGYDYLMSIEQDVIIPPTLVHTLLMHNKPIIGAPYIISSHTNKQRRNIGHIVSASKLEKILGTIDGIDVNEWYVAEEIEDKGLIRVKSCSLGCTLIASHVLKNIKVRYNPKIKRPDDSYFFHDCYINGIPVYLDTSFLWKIEHIKRLGGEIRVGIDIKNLE